MKTSTHTSRLLLFFSRNILAGMCVRTMLDANYFAKSIHVTAGHLQWITFWIFSPLSLPAPPRARNEMPFTFVHFTHKRLRLLGVQVYSRRRRAEVNNTFIANRRVRISWVLFSRIRFQRAARFRYRFSVFRHTRPRVKHRPWGSSINIFGGPNRGFWKFSGTIGIAKQFVLTFYIITQKSHK